MIPVFKPSCSDLEIKYVTEVLRSGWWTIGPVTGELETRFAEFTGARHAVAMNSCTTALHLTCQALGVAGGEVIMPALTFAATAAAVIHAGGRPVFADIDEDTLCLDWDDVKTQIGASTRAVIPVWYAGTTDPPRIGHLASYQIPVIEDCAHAAGSSKAGRIGAAACWSFNGVKNIAAGDGGMVTTDDSDLADRLRRLRRFGLDYSPWPEGHPRHAWDFGITGPGWKAHMNDITAAITLAQLERLDDLNGARRRITCRYLEEMAGLGWLRLPVWREDSSWHMFTVRVPAGRRDSFISHLHTRGVSARVHYRPLNTYEVFGIQPLPVTGRVWQTLVTLPLYPDMTDADVTQVITAVRQFR